MKNDVALKHRELSQMVSSVFFEVYNELGHGFWSRSTRKHSNMRCEPKGCGFTERSGAGLVSR